MLKLLGATFVADLTLIEGLRAHCALDVIESSPIPVDEELRKVTLEALDRVLLLANEIGARAASVAINRAQADMKESGLRRADVTTWLAEIISRFEDELAGIEFFLIEDKHKRHLHPKNRSSSSAVALQFPSEAAFELDEAAKCLAFGRYTACVFHLMRTMEVGIKAISRCLEIPDPARPADRNWKFILDRIKGAMDKKWPIAANRMSGDGATLESLYASLDAVRSPWRNATMHVDNKYTEEEAEHILTVVTGFMTKVAFRMDENGEPKA